ncbi:TonB-dependent siderophore receptor [Rhodocyclus tenuis]|uniref:Outer membrane receptor for ferric coprogen and ferric-rhodotorulic acid n=1 Tax=Rhodocyclus tenuis TaxID=1066 RepID=A0A840G6C6_RHOTE|nr:TonB-dependent siderophore receptor [Rhodocyclus tenuis]MBB4247435.1 outer membrane receptor for ferric coprogen and ferric-rhodotorulic acid [Rhodocyclus tenuis]
MPVCHRLPAALRRRPLALALAALCATPVYAAEPTTSSEEKVLGAVTVSEVADAGDNTERSGLYTARKSSSATGLKLSLRETPQTVSVISRSQLSDFRLDSVNDALAASSGINVERVETDRTYYTARGFDITNFQADGIGQPFAYGNVNGDIDTVLYERIEAVYGANGLMSGTGNPSATVNFLRKRPTSQFAAAASASIGSWGKQRVEGDISGSLVESGRIRGRLIAAHEDTDSYLDRYSREKTVFGAIVDVDLDDVSTLSIGHSEQRNKARSPMWGALPMLYSNGQQTNYDVSTSTASDWSYWNSSVRNTFVELNRELSADWRLRAVLTRNDYRNDGALFYAYGTPDATTGLGLLAYPSRYAMSNRQTQADVSASGRVKLFGRTHELAFGASSAESVLDDISHYGQGIGTALPSLDDWNGSYPMPSFDASVNGSHFVYKQKSAYAVARLSLADPLTLIAGAKLTRAQSNGTSYGVAHDSQADDVTPYAGIVYALTSQLSTYASYTDIFTPQYQTDLAGNTLAPVTGSNREIGLKGEFFARKLNASLALFRSEQRNLAEAAGYVGARPYHRAVDAQSEGVQIDIAGQVTPRLQLSIGYTQLAIDDDAGNAVRTYMPRRLLRSALTYRVPGIEGLKVGGSLHWQDDISRTTSGGEIRQKAYAVTNLMARYDFDRQWSVSANLNNVTNEKYLTSLYWDQSYYAAPRNLSVSLNWKY